ncbi:MAG: ACP S-malonyltransferase [Anaerovoracaceae bacterium]|nr:ACP S-malonyltransferase [Bacillota bacterium]MDY2671300.1 ACP S-malonyltransferase [Anaerovoracaceae bacterium]
MGIAYLFAGQGAQYPGMGRDLYENYEASRRVFDQAGERIKKLCFEGSAEDLKITSNTQPCVYTVTMAAYEAFIDELKKRGLATAPPTAAAGFSLGEYSALTAAGIIKSVADGTELMTRRGEWMDAAGRDEHGNLRGGMTAAIGRRQKILDCVEQAREDEILEAANLNAPLQTVVSGALTALDRFDEIAKANRIKPIRLAVGSAFHCAMMEPASEKMRELLLSKELGQGAFPVYANLTGRPVSEYRKAGNEGAQTGEDIADMLALQLMSPVRWDSTLEVLAEAGVDTFIEFGPGKTLSGLIKKNLKKVRVFNVEDCESLEAAVEGLSGR